MVGTGVAVDGRVATLGRSMEERPEEREAQDGRLKVIVMTIRKCCVDKRTGMLMT